MILITFEKQAGTSKRYPPMLLRNLGLIPFTFLLIHCNDQPQTSAVSHDLPINDMNNEIKHHKFYSRTDTTRLELPDSVWATLLNDDLYAVARRELPLKDRLPANTGITKA